MSFSIENLLNDAIKLSMDLKECEKESDSLIHQTVTLNKDNENIKEVRRGFFGTQFVY